MDTDNSRDKPKDNGILLAQSNPLKLSKEVMRMAVSDPELLNTVYKEISEKLLSGSYGSLLFWFSLA